LFFFFSSRRRHTRSKRDWSSDVCSSDLNMSTIDRVRQTYYGILQTQSALESTQETITSYRELDRVTSDKVAQQVSLRSASLDVRSEERRVGKECRSL